MLKIFISYSQIDKKIAGELKEAFEKYDIIKCFVAHDDIVPGSAWEQEILSQLQSSNFLMPIQTENLKNSYWCQQEVGFALAKNIKVIPLIPDSGGIDPIGFYAKFQGFRIRLDDLQRSVKQWLIKEGIIHEENAEEEEIEKRLIIFKASGSFYEAGLNTQSLLQLENNFTNADILKIAEIAVENGQILSSFAARGYLKLFFVKYANIIPKEQLEKFLSLG